MKLVQSLLKFIVCKFMLLSMIGCVKTYSDELNWLKHAPDQDHACRLSTLHAKWTETFRHKNEVFFVFVVQDIKVDYSKVVKKNILAVYEKVFDYRVGDDMKVVYCFIKDDSRFAASSSFTLDEMTSIVVASPSERDELIARHAWKRRRIPCISEVYPNVKESGVPE